jgi:uncharacterized membrane-anchored protein YjiN (DUF445 family)
MEIMPEEDVQISPPEHPRSLPEAKRITRERARDLGGLIVKYARRHFPEMDKRPEAETEAPPKMTGTHAVALRFLRVIPVILGALFLASFFWDFDGISADVFGRLVQFEGLLRVTAVSGLIGFLTNWLAITMLFRPRRRRPVFGQGLIPSQRERVIYRLAQAVSDELINEEIIKRTIQESGTIKQYRDLALNVVRGVVEDPEFRTDIKQLVLDYTQRVLTSREVRLRLAAIAAERIEDEAGSGFGALALRLYRYFREDDFQQRLDGAIQSIPSALDRLLDEADHVLDILPHKIEARADDIERWATASVLGFVEKMNVHGMIIENMRRYDESKLEYLIKNTSNEQLNYIKYLGGVLGLFGGLVIWQPAIALTLFGVVGGSLLLIDALLMKLWEKGTGV